MISKRIALLILLILLTTLVPVAGKDLGADEFWHRFREAVVTKNGKNVSSMTKFPFQVRGVDDSDPVKLYTRKEFPAIFKRVISQPVFLPLNGKIVSKTMLQVVAQKPKLLPADHFTEKTLHIEQFVFERVDGQWFFTRAYLEE